MISKLKHANRVMARKLNKISSSAVISPFYSAFDSLAKNRDIQQLATFSTGSFQKQTAVSLIDDNDDEEDNLIENENDQDNNQNNNNSNDQNDENDNKNGNISSNEGARSNLKAIPMQNWKATDLTEEELLITPKTHIIFSSQQPILPFSKIPCKMNTGNLS